MNSKHCNHKGSKRIKTFQMSYYVLMQCCNDVKIVQGKINKLKYRLYLQWCLFFTGCPFLVATGHRSCCCDDNSGISPNRYGS